MGQPVGSIVECTYVGRIFNQTVMNVFHYAVTTEATVQNPIIEQDNLLSVFWDNAAGTLGNVFVGVMPPEYTLAIASVQFIYPTRYRRSFNNPLAVGTLGEAVTANVQSTIMFQTDKAGKSQRGAKRMVMPTNQSDGGVISVIYKGLLQNVANEMITSLSVPESGGVYTPCIYHRAPNAVPKFDLITGAVVQDTTRVIRRRTVGVGV